MKITYFLRNCPELKKGASGALVDILLEIPLFWGHFESEIPYFWLRIEEEEKKVDKLGWIKDI